MARERRSGGASSQWRRTPTSRTMPAKAVEAIGRRRRQMLVHCAIYYEFNESVIDDHTWQKWADQLAKLQVKFGHKVGFYDEAFADWDGSTGYHLPYREREVMDVAKRVLRIHNQHASEAQEILR